MKERLAESLALNSPLKLSKSERAVSDRAYKKERIGKPPEA